MIKYWLYVGRVFQLALLPGASQAPPSRTVGCSSNRSAYYGKMEAISWSGAVYEQGQAESMAVATGRQPRLRCWSGEIEIRLQDAVCRMRKLTSREFLLDLILASDHKLPPVHSPAGLLSNLPRINHIHVSFSVLAIRPVYIDCTPLLPLLRTEESQPLTPLTPYRGGATPCLLANSLRTALFRRYTATCIGASA